MQMQIESDRRGFVSGGRIMKTLKERRRWPGWAAALLLAVAVILVSGKGKVLAQQVLDICGCSGAPGLTAFNAGDPSTYPPGTVGCSTPCSGGSIVMALPADGVLKFSSFTANGAFNVSFGRNAANTPATILVAGDVLLRGAFGCCQTFTVSGSDGSAGSALTAGVGGLGGVGGFRGGDAAAQAINGFTVGGSGFGPGGGIGGTPTANAIGGTFFGLPELLPLVGGSGGGGGAGFGGATNGGGLLIAANGTLTLQNYFMIANGGTGGSVGNGNCARGGAGGAGGAVRLVASRLVDGGTGQLFAQGQGSGFSGGAGTPGRIRLESIDTSAQTQFFTDPPALRVTGPGPLSNPVSPTVSITQVGGNPIPPLPNGYLGSIDVVLPAPGVTGVDVATAGVPSGTTVEVKVKARVGSDPLTSVVPLTCDSSGSCAATATFNLSAGAYVIEARATFQVQ
jgi:hypothetical protein